MSSLREDHELLQSSDTMEVATSNEFIVASSLSGTSDSNTLLSTPTLSNVGTSTTDSINFLTVQNQNGQLIIQQPIKTTNNGPTLVNNGASLPKGHIIVRQKPVGGGQQSLSASSSLSDVLTLEKAGMKRPLPSSGSNVITKVIITKNPISGQPQALQAGPPSQTFTITTLPSSGSVNSVSATAVVNPSGTPTKTVTLTSQGILSPVKTVIATIPSAGTSKLNIPYKIPISPSKAPTKITMIPVSRSPNKQVLNPANITVLSRALTTLAQTGNAKPGSPSKVIIKQGPAVSFSKIHITYIKIP